jgi:hypothetical protein
MHSAMHEAMPSDGQGDMSAHNDMDMDDGFGESLGGIGGNMGAGA